MGAWSPSRAAAATAAARSSDESRPPEKAITHGGRRSASASASTSAGTGRRRSVGPEGGASRVRPEHEAAGRFKGGETGGREHRRTEGGGRRLVTVRTSCRRPVRRTG